MSAKGDDSIRVSRRGFFKSFLPALSEDEPVLLPGSFQNTFMWADLRTGQIGFPGGLARNDVMPGSVMHLVAAAALLNEARVLAHPASIDNIPTSAGKEDHVSMGMTGALKLRAIVELAENLFAIELLAAAEGLEHRRPLKSGVGVERAFATLRKIAPPLTKDRSLSSDIARVAEAIRRGDFDSETRKS